MYLVTNIVQSLSGFGRINIWSRERSIATSRTKREIRNVASVPIEVDCETGSLSETQFRHALERERKRAQRSKSHSLLMLIDATAFIARNDEATLARRIAKFAAACMRETDLGGWSQTNAVFGILFTELGETGTEVATNAIRSKVMARLQKSFEASQRNKILVSISAFPAGAVDLGTRIVAHRGEQKECLQAASGAL
jgi:GGDEF domain-containing protein